LTRLAASAALALALCAVAPAHGQPGGPPPGVRGGGLATRAASNYLRLERDLVDALATRRTDRLESLLDESFDARSGADIDPVGRAEWLRAALGKAHRDARVRDLTVRELDDVAVVSFVLDPLQAPGGRASGRPVFVVDVWRRSTDKLLARYLGEPAPARAPARPSGRE